MKNSFKINSTNNNSLNAILHNIIEKNAFSKIHLYQRTPYNYFNTYVFVFVYKIEKILIMNSNSKSLVRLSFQFFSGSKKINFQVNLLFVLERK